jgi:hypothetical protein
MQRWTHKRNPATAGFLFFAPSRFCLPLFVRPYAPFVAGMNEAGKLSKKFPVE